MWNNLNNLTYYIDTKSFSCLIQRKFYSANLYKKSNLSLAQNFYIKELVG